MKKRLKKVEQKAADIAERRNSPTKKWKKEENENVEQKIAQEDGTNVDAHFYDVVLN